MLISKISRINFLSTLQSLSQSTTITSSKGRAIVKSSSMTNNIDRFVKEYYDVSMTLVVSLELAFWFRIFFFVIIFIKGSWILLAIYIVFIRARYSQSSVVQDAVNQFSRRVDALMTNQSISPTVRQRWKSVKKMTRRVADQTDINRFAEGQQPEMKKAQWADDWGVVLMSAHSCVYTLWSVRETLGILWNGGIMVNKSPLAKQYGHGKVTQRDPAGGLFPRLGGACKALSHGLSCNRYSVFHCSTYESTYIPPSACLSVIIFLFLFSKLLTFPWWVCQARCHLCVKQHWSEIP